MWVWSGRHDHARKETFLIAEQLQAARAAHWRQKQSPLLTLDDAQRTDLPGGRTLAVARGILFQTQ